MLYLRRKQVYRQDILLVRGVLEWGIQLPPCYQHDLLLPVVKSGKSLIGDRG